MLKETKAGDLKIIEKKSDKKITRYYRILNSVTKKYVTLEDGSFLVLQFPKQAEIWIDKRLKGSNTYHIVEWKEKRKLPKKDE